VWVIEENAVRILEIHDFELAHAVSLAEAGYVLLPLRPDPKKAY
jgi:hypothetical protein